MSDSTPVKLSDDSYTELVGFRESSAVGPVKIVALKDGGGMIELGVEVAVALTEGGGIVKLVAVLLVSLADGTGRPEGVKVSSAVNVIVVFAKSGARSEDVPAVAVSEGVIIAVPGGVETLVPEPSIIREVEFSGEYGAEYVIVSVELVPGSVTVVPGRVIVVFDPGKVRVLVKFVPLIVTMLGLVLVAEIDIMIVLFGTVVVGVSKLVVDVAFIKTGIELLETTGKLTETVGEDGGKVVVLTTGGLLKPREREIDL